MSVLQTDRTFQQPINWTTTFFLGAFQSVLVELPPLEKHSDLPGRFRFRRFDRIHDAVVLKLANKPVGAHGITSSNRRRRRRRCRRRR